MSSTRSLGHSGFFSELWPVLPLLLIAGFVLLWKLGAGSLATWDEAIYAEVSKEILSGGYWLTLHWANQPWFEKPPLFMWLAAISFRLFGISEFSARIPSALSGLVLIVLAYSIGKRAYGRRVGRLAAVILLTCYQFVFAARFGTMEVMLALFACLAIYGYLRLQDGTPQWWYLIWTSCALAIMVKGAGGMVAPVTVLLTLLFDRRLRLAIRSKHFWIGALIAILIAAPWHIVMFAWYGRAFIDEYVGYHVIARSTRTLEGHPSSPLYFVVKLLDGFFPWVLLTPFALVAFVRDRIRGRSQSWILLVLAVLVFGVYTLIPTRRAWYIVPMYPALSIIIGAFLVIFYENLQTRPLSRRLLAAGYAILIIAGAAYTLVSLSLNHRPVEPIAKLSRIAQATTFDKEPLLLFSETEPFYAQVPLFYSNRPIQQTYVSFKPATEDAPRYVNYEYLFALTGNTASRIIFRKEETAHLASQYDIRILAEDGPLVYAVIQRRSALSTRQ